MNSPSNTTNQNPRQTNASQGLADSVALRHEAFRRLEHSIRRALDDLDLLDRERRLIVLVLRKTLGCFRWHAPFQKLEDIARLMKTTRSHVCEVRDALQRAGVLRIERECFYSLNLRVDDWNIAPFLHRTDDVVSIDRWTDHPPQQVEIEFPDEPDLEALLREVMLESFTPSSSMGGANGGDIGTTLPGRESSAGVVAHLSAVERKAQALPAANQARPVIPSSSSPAPGATGSRNGNEGAGGAAQPVPETGTPPVQGNGDTPVQPVKPVQQRATPCSIQVQGTGLNEQGEKRKKQVPVSGTPLPKPWSRTTNDPTPAENALLDFIQQAVGLDDRIQWQADWLNAWIRVYPPALIEWAVEETLLRIKDAKNPHADFKFKTSPSAYLKGAITKGWRRIAQKANTPPRGENCD